MPNGVDLETAIRELSPENLRFYKQDLILRTKSLRPEQLSAVFERIKTIPELSDILGTFQAAPVAPEPELLKPFEAPPEEMAGWQQALHWVTSPFQWLHEEAIEPFAAVVTAPWSPPVAGTEELPWMERQLAEYEKWQAPWGVKGLIETLPWLAMPTAAGMVGRLGSLAAKGGALARPAAAAATAIRPIAAVERAVTYPIAKPLEMITARLAPKAAPEAIKAFSVPSNEVLEKAITKDDWMRRIAQWFGRKPVFKTMTEATGGRAATVGTTQSVEDVTARALLVGARVQETLLNSRNAQLGKLRSIHPDPIRLFGIDEATGIATKVKPKVGGASKVMAGVAEHPNNYILDATQSAYIKEVHRVEDLVLEALKREGVDVKLLTFDEFSHWVHRVVKGKMVDGKLVELRRGFGRIGSKQSFEKTRFYETAADGLQHGVVYSGNLEQVTSLYIGSAAKRIADQRIAQMVAPFGVKPTERLAVEIAERATVAARQYAGIRHFERVINRALRGEAPTEATLRAQVRRFPELGARFREAIGKPKELKALLKEAKALEPTLKAEYWATKGKRVEAMAIAKQPSLGTEATIAHPAFQGRIYPRGVADTINEYWADRGFAGLQKVATMSSSMRTLVAAADFSAMFIQGLPSIGLHPRAWARGAIMSFRAFLKPAKYQEYLTKELAGIQERLYYGGYAGGFEFMEAMGGLQRFAGRVAGRPGQAAIRQTYGRFEASFGAFGDVARNEMWKGLKLGARSEAELFEIARHLDRLTGVMSMKGLGIGRTQREFETAFMFFAPRYTRANLALIGDIFKGGLTGAEARKALGSMMLAGATYYMGICYALDQEPNFDPSTGRFMTIEITDPITGTTRHMGIGGMMTALFRLGADVGASAAELGMNERIDFIKLSRFDNPFIRFLYSRTAPMTGFITGMIEGKNFFGEPFENPIDYGKFMAEQVMPIAVQEMLMEEGGLAPTAMAAEELGMRTFPRSDWEKRDEIRDRLAMERYGMKWAELASPRGPGRIAQLELERESPELQEATRLAEETSAKMARGEGKAWTAWRKEGQAVEARYQQAIKLAAAEFDQTGDGTTFRQKVDDASLVRREAYATREMNPEYITVKEYFAEPLDEKVKAQMNPKDLARREYYQAMYSPDMYDEFGNYNFEEADRREAFFLRKYGQGTIDYIQEYMGAKWEPPGAFTALQEARATLEPYWDIETQAWAEYPPELKQLSDQIQILERTNEREARRILRESGYGPTILRNRGLIARYRKRMKLQNPEIKQALDLFYRY